METKEIQEFIESVGLPCSENGSLRIFISNWVPQSTYDHQQDYFLSDLKKALTETINNSK